MHFSEVIGKYVDVTNIGDSTGILPGLENLNKDGVLDLCAELSISLPRPAMKKSAFSYVGNSTLSGFPFPCQMQECRGTNFATTLAFSAIYSDEVVLFDPFIEIGGQIFRRKGRVTNHHRVELSYFIRQILTAQPLIERGICVFESAEHENYCSNCFSTAISIIKEGGNFDHDPGIFVSLIDSYSRTASVTYDGRRGERFIYRVSPNGDISDHDIFRYSEKKIGGNTLRKGERLPSDLVIKLGIPQRFAHYSSYDIIGTSKALQAGTRNAIASLPHMSSLADYFGAENFKRSISVEYPLFSQAALRDIIKFRDQEWHHLGEFRELVEAAVNSGEDATAEVKASSDRIDKILAKNKRVLERGMIKDALVSSTGIAATVLTSGVSGIVAAAAGVLSAGHLAKDLVPKIIDRFSDPESVRDEKAYYVWKLRKGFRNISH